jgi:uncharacterized protein (DUF433 family)
VYVVLEMLANGESRDDIRQEFPDLSETDLKHAIEFARDVASVPRQSLTAAANA